MPKPRLLVLASTFPARHDDGTPGFVRDLAEAEAEEFDTVVLVPAVPGAAATERLDGVRVVRFRYFFRRWEDLADGAILENIRARPSRALQVLPFLVSEAWALRRWARLHEPDVLHLHWLIPQGVVALGLMRRIPAVVTAHGGDVHGLRDGVSTLLRRTVTRQAATVTAANSEMRQRILDMGTDPTKVRVLPMGADLTAVRACDTKDRRLPGRLLFVGRLVEKKGLATLLAALRTLPPAVPWSLGIVGDGPLRAQLETAATGLPVTFRGQLSRSAVAAELARSEIVVVPSVRASSGDQDGLPVALLEAMGAGCPVIASDLPGINEVVVDGRSGVLVAPGDASALATAIRDLLGDPDRRDALGRGAVDAAESLSVDAVGARYRELLHVVIDSRSQSGPMATSSSTASGPTKAESERSRHRQGSVVVVDGDPLPNPATTGNILVGTITGRWLGSHSDVIRGTVLDLGCGNRPFEPWYGPLADTVIAVDPAPGAGPNVRALADRVPLRDESVDTVLCTEVLEHVERPEAAVAEIARVLRPGGHALITVPFLYPTHEAPYDFTRFTHFGLRSILTRHGLEVLDFGAQGGPATIVARWTFRALRAAIDLVGRKLGATSPLSLRRPFRWFVISPQQALVRLTSGNGSRLTAASRLASSGYLALARKPG